MKTDKAVIVTMDRQSRTAWNTFLQKGFYLEGCAGMTVREFLRESVGYDDCLIDETVRTVFLNSSPVDDIDGAHVKDGDVMALGSAMPGLVGICMGRDNPYKSFRSGIACAGDESSRSSEPIRVRVKVFSTLAVETGEALLKRGVMAPRDSLLSTLNAQVDHVRSDAPQGELIESLEQAADVVFVQVLFKS